MEAQRGGVEEDFTPPLPAGVLNVEAMLRRRRNCDEF
jgi:hypothetical protein